MNAGVKVRALRLITNIEDGSIYRAGETFQMYRPADKIRDLMQMCFVEILDGGESPAVVVSEDKDNGNNG
jgi:hypothetical protein